MERDDAVRISKLLSLGLRHRPDELGIVLDVHGWADVDALLSGLAKRGLVVTADDLEEIVRTSDKQRFALSPDGARIRANQGHSVTVDLDLPARAPPEILFHGTVARFLEPIRKEGLSRRARTHVHLSADAETADKVARRRAGEVVLLRVRAREMHGAGHVFYMSDNGVWLVDHVPPAFID
jgi:putative RNA 2'-phosphotransferase